jgi:N-dimethylarginine dimethylaminohydrolase
MNDSPSLTQSSQLRYLMCRPQYFAVTYSINPWMDPKAWADSGAVLHATAVRQWAGLHRALLGDGAHIELIEPEPNLPDLVFTANAAVVLDGKVLLARFRHPERRGEQPVLMAGFRALQARGLVEEIVEMPEGVALEGAGDCIWDRTRGFFWMGCGFRSDAAAGEVISEQFGVGCVAVALGDPSFYHLDTAFCALPYGDVIYYPRAFTPAALESIHRHVAPAQRIALDRADATRFAANAVCLDRTIVMSSCSIGLHRALEDRGYKVVKTPLHAFLRSGGSACCLTLRLDHKTSTSAARLQPAAQRASGHP